jgi:hypothetical protein
MMMNLPASANSAQEFQMKSMLLIMIHLQMLGGMIMRMGVFKTLLKKMTCGHAIDMM